MFYIHSCARLIFSLIFLVWTAGNQTWNTPSLSMELVGPTSTSSRSLRLLGQARGTDTVHHRRRNKVADLLLLAY
jgi:hypothetical protein